MTTTKKLTAEDVQASLGRQDVKTQATVEKIVQETIAEWIKDIEVKSSANNCNSIRCSDRVLPYVEKELIKLGFVIDDSEDMGDNDTIIHFSVTRV